MPDRRTPFGSVFADPWRKLFSLALAAGLWTVLHRQIMDSATIELDVLAVSDRELPSSEVLRRDRLYVVESDEWRLVGWRDEGFTGRRRVQLSIEAPNDVLAAFRVNPFGVVGPFDFDRLAPPGATELVVPLDLTGTGPIVFGRAGTLRDATLRIDASDKIELGFRRYRREVLQISPADLAISGLDDRTLEIDFESSKVEPERLSIRLRRDAVRPTTRELFEPLVVASAEDLVKPLVRTALWRELDLHYGDPTAAEPIVRLAFLSRKDAQVPEPIELGFNPAKKVQGYFLAVDAELPINPRDYVDFEPLQVDQALLRWKRPPSPEDLAELRERSAELQRYLYFCVDLSAMLDFEGPPPARAEAGERGLPFRILARDIRAPIEVRWRKDLPPGLAALRQWFEVEPAGATEVHCWRRP